MASIKNRALKNAFSPKIHNPKTSRQHYLFINPYQQIPAIFSQNLPIYNIPTKKSAFYYFPGVSKTFHNKHYRIKTLIKQDQLTEIRKPRDQAKRVVKFLNHSRKYKFCRPG